VSEGSWESWYAPTRSREDLVAALMLDALHHGADHFSETAARPLLTSSNSSELTKPVRFGEHLRNWSPRNHSVPMPRPAHLAWHARHRDGTRAWRLRK
jgi:hypothetical protein